MKQLFLASVRHFIAARVQAVRVWCANAATTDPSVTVFRTIRRRMTLWYCGVLTALLVLAGLVLYFGMQQELFRPVNAANVAVANRFSQLWVATGQQPCATLADFTVRPRGVSLYACYDAHGALIGNDRLAGDFSAFLTSDLAKNAIINGAGNDVIDGGTVIGAISRYATVVRDPQTHQVLGVIQVGIVVQGEERALSVLLSLILAAGLITLLGASLGGLWLAGRAMEPARIGYARQQQFIADVSHEIRTPLTLLRADAEVLLLDRAQFPERDAELLDDLVTETDHLTRLAHNLLMLARLDAHALPVRQEPVDVQTIAAQVAERVQAFASAQGVAVTVRDQRPVWAEGDPERIIDAALILAENAIKYNQSGGSVEVAAVERDGRAVLQVRDDGPGMAPEELGHLGERFYRPDTARSREAGGVGLGIAIAKEIAHALRGTLTYASSLGAGTTATLTLPLAAETPSEV